MAYRSSRPQPPCLNCRKNHSGLNQQYWQLSHYIIWNALLSKQGRVLPVYSPINLDEIHIGLLNKNRLERFLGQQCHQPDFHHCPLIWSVTGQGDTERSPPINSQRWGHFTLYKREPLYIYLYNSSGFTAVTPDELSRLIRCQSQEKCQQQQTGR